MLDKALKNYQDFLLFLSKRYQVICLSTPLPTIKDGQNHGQVANLRKDIKASQRDKTQLTIQFNKSMKRFCFQKKITYLDFDDESIGKDGLVHDKLINSDPHNHHYDANSYIEMIAPKLKKYI
ncbi:hypothetical protein NIES970_17610 [[Synechococcus] sp. NIES-970]|nr:hypothetical protein NIES970_17610 [[Synechococcus] sp. NIES-970]